MKHHTSLLLTLIALCACQCVEPRTDVIRVSSPSQYPHLVGRRVELVGVVSRSKSPQILGVDVDDLRLYAGRKMRVTGILRQWTYTQADIDRWERKIGAPPGGISIRGPGTYYYLDELKYKRQW